MSELNFKKDLSDIEQWVLERTIQENNEAVQLLASLLNTVYGLLLDHAMGEISSIFPIRNPERAKRFMTLALSMSALQIGSTIFDCLIKGRYSEAGALTRSLIETAAFAEYYFLNPDQAYQVVTNPESLPSRKAVFNHLRRKGSWPKGGPKKVFERYNSAAHLELADSIRHWSKASGKPQVTEMWIRGYSQESFSSISRDQIIPLLGIQEFFRKLFVDEDSSTGQETWRFYWEYCHDADLIKKNYPGMSFGPKDRIPRHGID